MKQYCKQNKRVYREVTVYKEGVAGKPLHSKMNLISSPLPSLLLLSLQKGEAGEGKIINPKLEHFYSK